MSHPDHDWTDDFFDENVAGTDWDDGKNSKEFNDNGVGFGDFAGVAASAIGGAISFGASAYTAEKQSKLGKDNQRFQKMMEETRYQRTMDDMRKAGLNPMLAYQQGGGSGASGGIASQVDAGAAVSGGMSSGAKVAEATIKKQLMKGQLAVMDAGSRASNAQAVKTENEARIVAAGIPSAEARGLYDATPEGIARNTKDHRNNLGMKILSNSPGGPGPRVLDGFEKWLTSPKMKWGQGKDWNKADSEKKSEASSRQDYLNKYGIKGIHN